MKAVIPAAGYGTRLLPATKSQPKEMLPVVDKPTIQYVIEEAVASGVEDILVITGRGKRAIEDHFDKSFELEYFLREEEKHDFLTHVQGIADLADIHYIRQKELRGLGHAVLCARKHVGDEPFAVLLGDTITLMDIPCTRTLLDIFRECGSPIIAVEEVPRDKVERYGIIDGYPIGERIYKVENLIEKPSLEEAPSNLAIFGRYILTPEIFDCLERMPPGRNNEIQLTDALRLLLAEQNIYAYKVEGKRYDIGSKIDWLKANIEIALAREDLREDLMDYLRMLHSY
ncbi:MAG: UTP--glucose-1-phosphate uridylyltransferase GalU [Actinomycetota bacterium]|nr:UTP--glucose-1-phosphate uridylyltransferase GalU [Actinomycetota bacterium]